MPKLWFLRYSRLVFLCACFSVEYRSGATLVSSNVSLLKPFFQPEKSTRYWLDLLYLHYLEKEEEEE